MKSVRTLKKIITGGSCEVYATIHHERVPVGRAVPTVEVFEDSVEVPTLGNNAIRHKKTFFSVVLCPDPEMENGMTEERLRGLMSFDLALQLPRKDEVLVPFLIYGATSADLSPEYWKFDITDQETVRKLLTL